MTDRGDVYDLADDATPEPPPGAPSANPAPAVPAATPARSDPAAPTGAVAAAAVPPPVPAPLPAATGGGWLGRLTGKLHPATPAPAPAAGRPGRGGRSPRSLRKELPAWVVSVGVHVSLLSALALAGLAPEVAPRLAELDAAMVDTSLSAAQAEELVHVYADPTNLPRDLASAEVTTTPGLGGGLTAIGAPSNTPRVAMATSVGERSSLPSVEVVAPMSGLALKPPSSLLTRTIGGGMGGLVAGDVTRATVGVGEALDQLAREILRELQRSKLTVIWLFDESKSMKDDQQAIKEKFDRITSELVLHSDPEHKDNLALTHVVAGFGKDLHYEQAQPTDEIERIARAIDHLKVDDTGAENTFHAIEAVIRRYGGLIGKDHRLLIVLVTDESSDDGDYIENARQTAVSRNVPIYIIGRQSLFGRADVTLPYRDPVTGDMYWPTIKRGPETAALECLQYDGLHGRWDEQPSGFAPYELARLTKDTGGIYFLLPSEEELRAQIHQREKAYSMQTLKEYVPDYESRNAYGARVGKSVLRRTLFEIIQQTREYGFRRHFPVEPAALAPALVAELPKVEQQLVLLGAIEKRLRALQPERDRDPEKRWQAHYDLILGQIAAYQVQAYEYGATVSEMGRLLQAGQLVPKTKPVPGQLIVEWVVDHGRDLRAKKENTGKQIEVATRLLNLVIERHPNSPWSDLAKDELARGFGCGWSEYSHTTKRDERAKFVPKF